MPLEEKHILTFIDNPVNERFNSELLDLLINRINDLCFKECQVDRIACTLTPMCSRRFLLKLKIKNGLGMEDLPKFCYSVHKGIVERDFRGKTVVYKPSDSYLYLIDFLDIFFHGDYRKLNKFISFKNWDEAFRMFDERIKNGEKFRYHKTDNYLIFKFEDRLHVVFLEEGYALTNANRENISDLELIKGILELYSKISFPDFNINLVSNEYVETKLKIPFDIISNVTEEISQVGNEHKESPDYYFWNTFPEDLFRLSEFCEKINLDMNRMKDLVLIMQIDTETKNYSDDSKLNIPLRYRDLQKIIDFIDFIYNKFYVIWV
ncbi:MAG: hypothetical protein ACQERB_07215 [Promethearchaeati archaeon]